VTRLLFPPVLPLRQVLPQRFSRDVLGVSGITDVLFYAGTNDFGDGVPPDQSITSLKNMVSILHTQGIKAIGATLISNVGQAGTTPATYAAHIEINDNERRKKGSSPIVQSKSSLTQTANPIS
jgi:hypothetical protein